MCRELITIPTGGVQNLPPSFLVNQLRDLMARQRREVVPKCSSHPNQELLFCETCDCVFCSLCTADGHLNTRDSAAMSAVDGAAAAPLTSDPRTSVVADHTVIPFSIAIKRMSEILLYKAKECTTKVQTTFSVHTFNDVYHDTISSQIVCSHSKHQNIHFTSHFSWTLPMTM